MSIVLIKKVERLERDVASLKENLIRIQVLMRTAAVKSDMLDALNKQASQAKPTEQPAEPPDLRTREGKAWKNANSLR